MVPRGLIIRAIKTARAEAANAAGAALLAARARVREGEAALATYYGLMTAGNVRAAEQLARIVSAKPKPTKVKKIAKPAMPPAVEWDAEDDAEDEEDEEDMSAIRHDPSLRALTPAEKLAARRAGRAAAIAPLLAGKEHVAPWPYAVHTAPAEDEDERRDGRSEDALDEAEAEELCNPYGGEEFLEEALSRQREEAQAHIAVARGADLNTAKPIDVAKATEAFTTGRATSYRLTDKGLVPCK